jgi:LmbE family N-acetylglucosaminyl deacetylase
MTTVVAFHAHPDDEVMMTGGTLALASAAGHRVVIVVATDGIMGAASESDPTRLEELRASAAVLGAQRVVHLGYADSGHGRVLYPDPPDRARFVRAEIEEAAARLAAVLREERAAVLLSYDANGVYGHRDHVKVHEVGKRAAELAGVSCMLEATIPRAAVDRFLRLLLLRIPFRFDTGALRTVYSPRAAVTHSVDVRRFARQKQAALAAHRSQWTGHGRLARVLRVLVRLPLPVFGLLLGREWYVGAAAASNSKVIPDLLKPAR